MADKKSFKLYKDSLCILDELDNEQAGVFIKAIKQYQETRTLPELDLLLRVVIKPFLLQFDRDDDAYEVVCEVNKVNGVKGGRPKKTEKTESVKNNPTEPKETEHNPTKPKKADTDTDTDKEKDILEKHKLVIWLEQYCPEVQKLKKPITNKEAEKIQERFKGKFKTVESVFLRMENHKGLSTKYKSAYLTFCQWVENMKPEVEQNESILKNPTSVPYPINLY